MMSGKIKARLKKRIRTDETPSETVRRSTLLDNGDISVMVEFNAQTLRSSPPLQLDNDFTKKVPKKKLRCTNEFNQLRSSSVSQDSDGSVKTKSKKTKKSKKLYSLPKISQVTEDIITYPDNILHNLKFEESKTQKRLRLKKQEAIEILEHTNQEIHQVRQSKIVKAENNLGALIVNEVHSAQSIAHSISDDQRDSEVEPVQKNKKHNKSHNTDASSEKVKTNWNVSGKLSHLSIQSNKKSKRNSSWRTSTDEINSQTISEIYSPRNFIDKQNKTNKKSPIKRLSHKINCTSLETKFVNCEYNEKKKPKRSARIVSTISVSDDFSTSDATMKIKPNGRLTLADCFDISIGSDDVFNTVFEKQLEEKEDATSNDQNPISSKMRIKTRKSICFQSPQENSRRSTFIPSKSTTEHSPVTITAHNGNNGDCSDAEINLPVNGSSKGNSTFEISSPRVLNKINSFGTNLSRRSIKDPSKRDNSIVSGSSIMTTPLLKKTCDLNATKTVNLSNCVNKSEMSAGSFQIEESEHPTTNGQLIENTPKLVRTATFTKEETPVQQISNPLFDLKYSPITFDSPHTKTIDSSKVNKRRRWDKSRLSTSFLHNSFDISNISAPWQENETNKTPFSDRNGSKQNLEIKASPKSNVKNIENVSLKNCRTPLSGCSTPFPKGKTNLLRQALLKGREVTNETKVSKENLEKPVLKTVRTKIPNFALIHQRAYDKLENLKEMSERKAARAKLLLSGYKPPSENIPKMSNKRRELKFSPPHKKVALTGNEGINKSSGKSNISITKINNISPSKSNPKLKNKENKLTPLEKKREHLNEKSKIPKPKMLNIITAEKKGYTRFGFKVGSDNVKTAAKDNQVKAVAGKTNVAKNTLQERRNVINGVRSNRRFELLMKMRNKN